MDEKRFLHTSGVRFTAASMAMAHGADIMKAQAAGLLHDIVKQTSDEEKLDMAEYYGMTISDFERKNPFIIHGPLAAHYAAEKFGITDQDLLNAITYHTTGRPAMSVLEQIIFIADYIEPARDKVKELPYYRKMAFQDLDETCYLILDNTLNYLSGAKREVDDMSRQAYLYYKQVHEGEI